MPNFYWDEQLMISDGVTPTILAIGDSWFWYPFLGGSLINNLGPVVAPRGHSILAKGMNGAEAGQYVHGPHADQFRETLRKYGASAAAVLVSGGGNDFAGFNDLRPLLKASCRDETTAPGCFRDSPGGLAAFIDTLERDYRDLVGIVHARTGPGCHVVMHTYAYAIPDGRGVFGDHNWLRPALLDAGVRPELHRACIRYLLDTFADMLLRVAASDPAHFHVVDSRKTLLDADWANELHPTPAGFRKLANGPWRETLRPLGLA